MPKRRRSDGRGGGRTAKPPRRHLYLILDDWSLGYSIRKFDLSSDFDCDESGQLIAAAVPNQGSTCKPRLPSAIFRFEAQRGLPMYFAAAFGSKLIAMHPIARATDGTLPSVPRRSFPVFDVRQRSVIYCPRQMPNPVDPIFIPVGDRLFALSAGCFDMLCPPPDGPGIHGWVWSWHELAEPPFRRKYVTSYTVHSDGRTIFVSIDKRGSPSTFTFDTSVLNGNWKRHGKWMLPFNGRAHFDCVLDAWVGLSRSEPGTIGQLFCSCDVVSANPDADGQQCPAVKLCKEKLFSEDPALMPVGATLLYMGSRSEFCLVEFVCCINGDVTDGSVREMNSGKLEAGTGCLLRLTTFFLVYDKKGNLTTGKQGRVRYYGVRGEVSEPILKCPVAFFM